MRSLGIILGALALTSCASAPEWMRTREGDLEKQDRLQKEAVCAEAAGRPSEREVAEAAGVSRREARRAGLPHDSSSGC